VESEESQAEEHTLKKAKKTKVRSLFRPLRGAPLLRGSASVQKPVPEDEQGETTVQISPEGDKYVSLGKRKRATVRIFKGAHPQIQFGRCLISRLPRRDNYGRYS
jgi:hypothetical protein